jgi:hypothetical protein
MRRDLRPLGFFFVLAPPLVLAWSARQGWPIATFAIFVAGSPVTRYVFDVYRPGPLHVGERLSRVLYALPAAYLLALTASLIVFAHTLPTIATHGWMPVAAAALSGWTVMVFGLFPAHEMFHRRSAAWIRLGAITSGLCGYPLWPGEHMAHHRADATLPSGEIAGVKDAPWSFAVRRVTSAFRAAIDTECALRRNGASHGIRPLRWATFAMAAASLASWWWSGLPGLVLYLGCAVGVTLAAQLMTYVQHWGLATPVTERGHAQAWEDDCLMQAWLTMGNSFHLAHHREAEVPYFYLQPQADSPRQPGCYVVMLVLCLVPAFWRQVMAPVRDAYLQRQPTVCRPGRRVLCIRPTAALALDDTGRTSKPLEEK